MVDFPLSINSILRSVIFFVFIYIGSVNDIKFLLDESMFNTMGLFEFF